MKSIPFNAITSPMSILTDIPWTESPSFETELRKRNLNEKEAQLARDYRSQGYLVLENLITDEALLEQLISDTIRLIEGGYKCQDGWQDSQAIRSLSCNEQVLSLLQMLYGRRPIPFQTLNMEYGTEQRLHADIFPFDSIPSRFMCGVWVALEDLTLENGPLEYVPGSHRLPTVDFESINVPVTEPYKDYETWENKIEALVEETDLEVQQLQIKRGSALIWAANLLHGGAKRLDKNQTRLSQVTHYFFEDCIYTTPLFSVPRFGEYFVREITDISTGEAVTPRYNGRPVYFQDIPGTNRKRISFEPRQDALTVERQAVADTFAAAGILDHGKAMVGKLKRRLF